MHWERASEDIYIFTSDRYAQVTASLIVSGNTGILIDTLPFPSETAQIALFARKRCPDGVRFVIYTGHEADHVYGAFLFPKAEIIAHEMAREILIERGFAALQRAKEQSQEFAPIQLRLPTFTFTTNSVTLRMPGKTLEIMHTPGHTPDCVSVLLHEERILFAGDTVMALPTITNGDPDQLKKSLEAIGAMQLENIVQGHGEIILRGEIRDTLRRQINYMDNLRSKVQKLIDAGGSRDDAKAITIEQCGMPRVLLNGAVVQLHLANVLATYDRLMAAKAAETARSASAAEKPKATKKPAAKKSATAKKEKEKPARAKKSGTKQAAQKRTSKPKAAAKQASKPAKRKAAPQTKASKKSKGKGR
ncbi:MAG: MBL fold metallo-hydrolase [Anaerolineae bacterium]|nr:MBL fold metallo-hydrolase [Candidatus Roseilinea sp.]MDW8448546.1 MBL fold metallo-hydrolase [Anaerolineae bacterium]